MSMMPKRNLAPESEPWGRKVDERLDSIDKTVAQNKQDTSNAQSAVNSTVTKLSEQVAAIDELTQELAAQQASLEEQQVQLSAQVQAIEEVVNAQVYPVTFHRDAVAFTLSAGPGATIVSGTVPVPVGYTRALVYATHEVTGANSSGSGDSLNAGLRISGAGLGWSPKASASASAAVSISTSAAALLTSLGPSILIEGRAYTDYQTWANNNNTANLNAMIIFLR